MADAATTVDVLSSLPFGTYDSDWVKSVWDKEFMDIDPLSLELENDLREKKYHVDILHKVSSLFDDWIREKAPPSEGDLWTVLVKNNVSYKSFTAFLAYLMELGHRRVATSHQREAGILAASHYFKFMTITVSSAFMLFHPVLFQKGVNMLKSWTSLETGHRKRQANVSSSQLGNQGGRGKRARRATATPDPIEDPFEEDEEEETVLTGAEINRIKKAILGLLKAFIQLLEKFSLSRSVGSSYHVVSVLSELTNVDPELFDGDFERTSLSGLPISALAYKGLLKLLSPSHGEVFALTTSVFKHLLPRLLMFIGDNKGVAAQTIPRTVLLSRDHAVDFVCYLIKGCDETVLSVVRILVQHMCVKVPDKAEYRSNVAKSVVKILKQLSTKNYVAVLEWILKFSRNGKSSYRGFSIDVIGLLLNEPVRQACDDIPDDKLDYLSKRFLVEIILARCSDVGPTVRARAITTFSQCLSSGSTDILGAVRELVTPKPLPPNLPGRLVTTPDIERAKQLTEQAGSGGEKLQTDVTEPNLTGDMSEDSKMGSTTGGEAPTPAGATRDTPVVVNLQTPEANVCLQDSEGVVSMLRRRACDQKVLVRKAALQALESVIKLEGAGYRMQNVDVLKDRCRDPALSVRRQAMQSLTDLLLSRPQDKQLQCAWLEGVLPMVMDPESSAQERCLELLEDLVLRNIVPFHRTIAGQFGLVWDLLDIMAGDSGVELRRFLQRACQRWSRDGKVKPKMIDSLQTHINQENDAAAWLLLSEIAPCCPKFKHDFVLDYWRKTARTCDASQYTTCQRVLAVLGSISKQLSEEDRSELLDDLKTKLLAFDFPPQLVAASVSTLSKLCDLDGDNISQKEQWCTELLFACDTYLSDLILNESPVNLPDEDKVVRHLFTLGEIAQLCPANTPKRVFMLVQSLIAAPCLPEEDSCSPDIQGDSPTAENTGSSSQGSEVSPEATPGSQSSPPDPCTQSSRASRSSQGSQATGYTQSTQILSQFRGSKMSAKIRAHAFVTLGKLCLQNEDVAKKCVSALARELEISPDPAVRNNVVIILCDLCIRYTTLVDRYVVNIAACLKDNSPLVRKQTLTLLTRLLQEDFLKWKGVLFFRFITSMLDESKDICNFAEFCLTHILLLRNPNMFFHHFAECVFHFNSYEAHSVYNKFQQTDREKQMFSLKGPNNKSKRLKLYRFMLEHMADDQRFKLTAKLCQDILGGVVDNILPMSADTSQLLEDTLTILCCKEIKLASLKAAPQEDVADEQEMAEVVMATAKKTLITQVVKKNVIENIVPIVTSLKHVLEHHRSPVLKHLMLYLRELMKDYKNEVQEILATDRQLATEIEYDLRKFEEQEANPQAFRTPHSPRSVSSPRAGGSKTSSPAAGRASPRPTSGGPRTTSPGTRANTSLPSRLNTSSQPSTPGVTRQMSMSTLAILNSAKKAMDKVQKVKETRNTPIKTKADGASRRKVADKDAVSGGSNVDENSPASPVAVLFKTPNGSGKNRRAISTPASVLGNITFHQDQNITLVPPSPIPSSLSMRVFDDPQSSSDSSLCATPKAAAARVPAADKDLVYMFSPDKPLPKPRPWKVTATPAGKESTTKTDEATKPETEEGAESPAGRRGSARSRLTRRSLRLQNS